MRFMITSLIKNYHNMITENRNQKRKNIFYISLEIAYSTASKISGFGQFNFPWKFIYDFVFVSERKFSPPKSFVCVCTGQNIEKLLKMSIQFLIFLKK